MFRAREYGDSCSLSHRMPKSKRKRFSPAAGDYIVADRITLLLLEVAKRADEFARDEKLCGTHDLKHWMDAEREVLSGVPTLCDFRE
jgi:hypothetical protein